MYYNLESLQLRIYDEKNKQHKIVQLQKPYQADTLEDILRFVEERAETLGWLPTHVVPQYQLRRLKVKRV